MKYRSRTDIVYLILEAARNDRITKTRIMYKAFLSHAQLKEYLSMLTEKGLLEYDKGTATFRTTAKGMKFLKVYDQIEELANTGVRTTAEKKRKF